MEKIKEVYQKLNKLDEEYKDIDYLHFGGDKLFKVRKSILNLYKEYLQIVLTLQNSNPNKVNNSSLKNCNCYFYALALPIPKIFQQTYYDLIRVPFGYDVGEIGGYDSIFRSILTEKLLLERIYADLEALKIKYYPSSISSANTHNGYKINAYIGSRYNDFHFTREYDNDYWLSKDGYKGKVIPLKNNDTTLYNNDGSTYNYVATLEIVKNR